jgi:hypothetical protein
MKDMTVKKEEPMRKKIITAVIIIVVILSILFAAKFLVNSFDFIELLKKIHGG